MNSIPKICLQYLLGIIFMCFITMKTQSQTDVLNSGSTYMYSYGVNGTTTTKWDYVPDPGITSSFLGCKLFRQDYYNTTEILLSPVYLFETTGKYVFIDTINILDTVPYVYSSRAYYTDTILFINGCQAVKYVEMIPINTNTLHVKIKPRVTGYFIATDYCGGALYNIPCYDSIVENIEYYPWFDYCEFLAFTQSIFTDSGQYQWGSVKISSEYFYNLIMSVGLGSINNNSINIYPTPGNEYIRIDKTSYGDIFYLFDTNGHLLINQNINSKTSIINTTSLKSGFYYYQIKNNNYVVKSGKWVKM